jgi:hypothetical protein
MRGKRLHSKSITLYLPAVYIVFTRPVEYKMNSLTFKVNRGEWVVSGCIQNPFTLYLPAVYILLY